MGLFDRAKNIIASPKSEWSVIAEETPDIGGIITGYALPLAGAAAVAQFIGIAVIGAVLGSVFGSLLGGFGVMWGVKIAIQSLIVSLASVFITAFVVDALAPSFGSEKNMGRAVQLVTYSYTPAWVGGLLAIIPGLGILGSLFGLYGIYLLYLGFPEMMKTPQDKVVVYMIVTAVILIGVGIVLGLILTPLFALSVIR